MCKYAIIYKYAKCLLIPDTKRCIRQVCLTRVSWKQIFFKTKIDQYPMNRRMIRGQGHVPPGYSVEYDGSSDWPTDRFGRTPSFWLKHTHISWFVRAAVCIPWYIRVTHVDRRPLSIRRRCPIQEASHICHRHILGCCYIRYILLSPFPFLESPLFLTHRALSDRINLIINFPSFFIF